MSTTMAKKDLGTAADLIWALEKLPNVRRALTDKPGKWHDAIHLELSGAEMIDGESQGATHYFAVTPAIGRAILDAADKIIRAELTRLGVKLPKVRG